MVDKFKSMSDQLVLLISEVPLRMENFEAINMNCPTQKFQQSIVSEAMLLLSDLVFRYLHSQICLDVGLLKARICLIYRALYGQWPTATSIGDFEHQCVSDMIALILELFQDH